MDVLCFDSVFRITNGTSIERRLWGYLQKSIKREKLNIIGYRTKEYSCLHAYGESNEKCSMLIVAGWAKTENSEVSGTLFWEECCLKRMKEKGRMWKQK